MVRSAFMKRYFHKKMGIAPPAPQQDYHCTIMVEGTYAKIDGVFPSTAVVDATSYFSPGYEFTPRYRNHMWDGRIKLYRRATRTFPAGLLPEVVEALQREGAKVQVDDQRHCPAAGREPCTQVQLEGVSFSYPFDYQPMCAQALVDAHRGIAAVATNGGKTTIAALVVKALRLPTLFMVPSLDLLHQTRQVFMQRLGLSVDGVGICGDSKWQPGKWITVATVDTLRARLEREECQRLLRNVDVMFIDECHHTGSDTWYEVVSECRAFYRFGLSGTPLKRTDGADLRLVAATGKVVYEIRNKELIERRISVRPHIQWIKIKDPLIASGAKYPEVRELGIVENVWRNTALCRKAAEFVEQGLSVLILVDELKHGRIIDEKLWTYRKAAFLPHQFISGEEPTEVRSKAFEDFKRGTIKVLIATSIMNEGIDMPNIDVLILAAGGKSSIRTLQRIGRGLRKGGNIDKLYVVDTVDFQHKYLLKHSLQRLTDYKDEGCFEIETIS